MLQVHLDSNIEGVVLEFRPGHDGRWNSQYGEQAGNDKWYQVSRDGAAYESTDKSAQRDHRGYQPQVATDTLRLKQVRYDNSLCHHEHAIAKNMCDSYHQHGGKCPAEDQPYIEQAGKHQSDVQQ